jgi:hypothetical protein
MALFHFQLVAGDPIDFWYETPYKLAHFRIVSVCCFFMSLIEGTAEKLIIILKAKKWIY